MQLPSFVIVHQLEGMVSGTIVQSSFHVLFACNVMCMNRTYSHQLRVDFIGALLFATISEDKLGEAHNINHSFHLCQHLQS